MNTTARKLLITGAINGLLFVALGAFGAHGLKSIATPEQLAWFKTGTSYHGIHAIALLITGLAAAHFHDRKSLLTVQIAAWLFLLGILLFCGSLYAMTLGAPRWLGAITPIGGIGFLAGWAAIILALAQDKSRDFE